MITLTEVEPAVRKIAARYFVVGMDEDDVVQYGLIGAWKGLRTWKPEGGRSPFAWATYCAEREIQTAVMTARREKRLAKDSLLRLDHPISEGAEDTFADLVPDNRPGPAQALEQNDLLRRIFWAASTRLSELELGVFEMLASGCSYAEVAEALGIGKKSVDNAYGRATVKLSSELLAA